MTAIIYGGTIVNEGQARKGSIVIEDGLIAQIIYGHDAPRGHFRTEVDATGRFVFPGVIDEHVHFREPGLTAKADIESESRAAAWGGVTSFFDMPNTVPNTVSLDSWQQKMSLAAAKSHVNYAFFFGATTANSSTFSSLDRHRLPGIKLFMGASTGGMLVDEEPSLRQIFKQAAAADLPLMTHCEDTRLINANMKRAKAEHGDDPDISLHPQIRSREACLSSTRRAVSLAREYGTRLHVAHISTADELSLFGQEPNITAEAVIAHLLFSDSDYRTLGSLIKCNPAVKTADDRSELRRALVDGRITTVATDHAPHLLADKQGGCARAASGMPMIQFSLPVMLQLADEGVLTIPRVVELMCHAPARLFQVRRRGFLREGYAADIVVAGHDEPWQVSPSIVQSKCGWTPLSGRKLSWRVLQTFCNGHLIYNNGHFDPSSRGQAITFR